LTKVDRATYEEMEAGSKAHLAQLFLDPCGVLADCSTWIVRKRFEPDGQAHGEQNPRTEKGRKADLGNFDAGCNGF
jgi:hypothetical protein